MAEYSLAMQLFNELGTEYEPRNEERELIERRVIPIKNLKKSVKKLLLKKHKNFWRIKNMPEIIQIWLTEMFEKVKPFLKLFCLNIFILY